MVFWAHDIVNVSLRPHQCPDGQSYCMTPGRGTNRAVQIVVDVELSHVEGAVGKSKVLV